MATQEKTKRRNLLLAVLLALIAAGTLCVWGVAAAGYTFSSPLLVSIAAFFSGDRATTGTDGGTGGGDGGVVIPATGSDGGIGSGGGDVDGGGGSDGSGSNGGGTANQNCLLGIICLNAQVDSNLNGSADSGDGTSADANSSTAVSAEDNTNCFLGLICVTSHNQVNTGDALDSGTVLDAKVDEDGVDLDTDSDANLDTNNADNNNCLLGLICLNAIADATSGIGEDASLASTVSAWWQSFLNIFITANARS